MPLRPRTGEDTLEVGRGAGSEGFNRGEGLESANSVKKIQCLCGARRARSRGVVCLPGAVVVVVGVDLLVVERS